MSNPNQVELPLAEKSKRAIAFIIDFTIYCMILIILSAFFGKVKGFQFELEGIPALAGMGFAFLLFPILEGLTGQTIGKSLLGIEVVKDNYSKNSLGRSFVRFFLGFLDLAFCIGLIVAFNNPKNKRIGDLIAGTIVVEKKK